MAVPGQNGSGDSGKSGIDQPTTILDETEQTETLRHKLKY